MFSWEYEGLKRSYNLKGGLGVAVGFLARGLNANSHSVTVEMPFFKSTTEYDDGGVRMSVHLLKIMIPIKKNLLHLPWIISHIHTLITEYTRF